MCTTPRQLLPSVFGGNVYPHGLRRTFKLLTCPSATDSDATMLKGFALAIGLGGKTVLVNVCVLWECVHRCKCLCMHRLLETRACQNSHTCKLLLHDMVTLLYYALLQHTTQAICYPTHEGEQTVCLNEFQVSHATTPTLYCRGTVSLSPALCCIFISFSSLVLLTSSQMNPKSNPVMLNWILKHAVCCGLWVF